MYVNIQINKYVYIYIYIFKFICMYGCILNINILKKIRFASQKGAPPVSSQGLTLPLGPHMGLPHPNVELHFGSTSRISPAAFQICWPQLGPCSRKNLDQKV